MAANIKTVARYAVMFNKRKELETRIAKIKAEMKALEEGISEYFIRQGTESWSNKYNTVSLRRELWPATKEGANMDELRKACEGTPFEAGVYPSVNSKIVGAVLREIRDELESRDEVPEDANDIVPEALRPYLGVSEILKVSVRRK